jgi:nitrate reductase molybdenum cofactor assembly chaperone
MTITRIYEALAELLEYPSLKLDIESCSTLISNEPANVTNSFAEFRASVAGLSLNELQEVYTRTFDLSPVCALDIGYHLFGENYKRGVFLANLRETEAPFDLGQEHQLPDYLPVLLRLLTTLDDEELRSALIVDCMIPALEKMLKTLGEGENPYRHLIAAVNTKLKSEAGAYPATIQRAHLPVLQAASFSAETNTDLF